MFLSFFNVIHQSDLFTIFFFPFVDLQSHVMLEIQRGSAGLREIRSRDTVEHVLWNMFCKVNDPGSYC